MALLDFFWKKAEHLADSAAQSIDSGISERFTEVSGCFTEISERLRRIETKQKETSIQLEEIDDFLQTGGNESALVDALVSLADTIGDFYYFAAEDEDSPLFEQARLMWNSASNAAAAAGLEIINANSEPFDFRIHSAESTEHDGSMPNGYVIRTLKCGYIYKDEIIRRAAVVVNKWEDNKLESSDIDTNTKIDVPNIIYL